MTTNVEKLKAVLEKAAGDNEAGIGTAVGGAALAGGVAFGAHKGTQAYFRKQGLGEVYDKSRMGVIGGKAEAAAGKVVSKGKSLMGRMAAAFSKVAEEEKREFKSTAAGAAKGALAGGAATGAATLGAMVYGANYHGMPLGKFIETAKRPQLLSGIVGVGAALGAARGHAKAEEHNLRTLSKSAALKDILAKLEQND